MGGNTIQGAQSVYQNWEEKETCLFVVSEVVFLTMFVTSKSDHHGTHLCRVLVVTGCVCVGMAGFLSEFLVTLAILEQQEVGVTH